MNKPIMLCVGSAAQDVFLQGSVFTPECEEGVCYEHLKLGDKLSVESLTFATGGNAMNAAITFARQKLDTSFVSLLGDDPAGQAILRQLDHEEIHAAHVITDESFTTSYSTVLLAPSGERTILNYKSEPLSSRADILTDDILDCDWLYVSSLGSMEVLADLMKRAHRRGVKIAFNPATFELQHVQKCADLLSYVELFAVNKEEAQLFVKGDTLKSLAAHLSQSVKYVLVSDGPNGSLATDGESIVEAGMYEDVPVIDRTGAGDAFTSGFVAMIALGKGLEEAITFASANSTSVVSQIGANKGVLAYHTKIHSMELKAQKIV